MKSNRELPDIGYFLNKLEQMQKEIRMMEEKSITMKIEDIKHKTLEFITPQNDLIIVDHMGHVYHFRQDGSFIKKFSGAIDFRPSKVVMLDNDRIVFIGSWCAYTINFKTFSLLSGESVNNINPDNRYIKYGGDVVVALYPNQYMAIGGSLSLNVSIFNISDGKLYKNIDLSTMLDWHEKLYYRGTAAITFIDQNRLAITNLNGFGNVYIYDLEKSKIINQFRRNNDTSESSSHCLYREGVVKLMTSLPNGYLAIYATGQRKEDPSKIYIYHPMNGTSIAKFIPKQKNITSTTELSKVCVDYNNDCAKVRVFARLIGQGMRDQSTLFSKLPAKAGAKIAGYFGGQVLSNEESEAVALSSFNKLSR